MADPILDVPTSYFTTFPEDTGEWTHLPLPETTKLELMQLALDRSAAVTREEVDAVHTRLLGISMPTEVMAPPPEEPPPPEEVRPPREEEARAPREEEPSGRSRRGGDA